MNFLSLVEFPAPPGFSFIASHLQEPKAFVEFAQGNPCCLFEGQSSASLRDLRILNLAFKTEIKLRPEAGYGTGGAPPMLTGDILIVPTIIIPDGIAVEDILHSSDPRLDQIDFGFKRFVVHGPPSPGLRLVVNNLQGATSVASFLFSKNTASNAVFFVGLTTQSRWATTSVAASF